jgi:hypothetical protein
VRTVGSGVGSSLAESLLGGVVLLVIHEQLHCDLRGLHGQVDELPIHTPHGPQSQRNTRSARDAEGHTAEILPHVPPYHRIPSSYVFPKPSTAPSMAAAPFDAVGRPPPWCSGERTPRKTRCARLETSSPHDRTTRGPTRESARQTHPSSEERERIDSLGPWRQLR